MNDIFLDTETTGLSFSHNHKIVEIACIETKDLVPINKIFHKLINPERDVPDEAFKIHGFSTDFLKDKPTFKQVADEFVEFIKDKKLIIHNAKFDVGFLNHELKLLKKNEIKIENVIDTLDIARGKYPGTSNSLDALCKRFGIDLSKRTKHNALLDCELLREVYINITGIKEPKLVFNNEFGDKDESNKSKKKIIHNKKVIKITNEEEKKHKDFIQKELKKNFY
jgi:DNA polymerase III subunit epsilon